MGRFLNGFSIRFRVWIVTADPGTMLVCKVELFNLCIFGDIYQHGSRSTGFGNIESLGQDLWNFRSFGYLTVPFGYRGGYSYNIGFLKSIGPQQMSGYLACNAYHGRRIYLGIRNTGN